jgi:SpoIID/LytB domain protein
VTTKRLVTRCLIPVSTFALLASVLALGADRSSGESADSQATQGTPAVVRDHAVKVSAPADRVKVAPAEDALAAPVGADTVVAELPATEVKPFAMLGVTWKGGLDPAETRVQARWRADGTWTKWTEMDIEPAEEGTPGTEPVWVDEADAAAIRIISTPDVEPTGVALATIDPGATPTVTRAAATTAAGDVPQPSIISRSAWGASSGGSCDSPIYGPSTKGVVIHHTAGSNSYSASQSASIVKAVQAYHVKSRDWCDIGYNFLVDKYGQIFEGRKGGITKSVRAAHSGNAAVNEQTAGISLMGTFESTSPTTAMKTAVAKLAAWKLALHGVPATGTYAIGGKTLNRIAGHRNVVSTACPGAKVYSWLTSTSSTGLRPVVADLMAKAEASEPLPTPTGLAVTGRTASTATLDWADVDGAEKYHVKASTSSSMSAPVYGKFTESNGTVTGLQPGKTYYFSVVVVDPVRSVRLSAYSPAPYPSVTLPSTDAASLPTPAGLTVSSATPTSLTFDWDDVKGAEKYHVRVSTSSSMAKPVYGKFTQSTGTVAGLKAGTKYYFGVAVVDPVRTVRLSEYTKAPYPSASTPTTTAGSSKTAGNTTSVPSSRTISIKGHGYGHGIGMSQYGAEGAARDGKSYATILDHYYPGTSLATRTGDIRVLMSGDTTNGVLVKGESGLKLQDLSGRRTIALPTTVGGKTVDRWEIVRTDGSASRSKLQYRTTGAYSNFNYKGAPLTWSGDGQFTGPSTIGLIMPGGATINLRGDVRSAKPSSGSSQRDTVNVVSIDDYVRGVIAAEMPSSWHTEALKAQAVAARTYGVRSMSASRHYDICSTTACQVYGGASRETSSTDSAVKATAGKILTYQGKPAFTQFSSSSGGYSNTGSQPYLKATSDPWDNWSGNQNHAWTISVTASKIEKAYTSIGTLKSLQVVKRNGLGDMGGRVLSVKLTGSKATKTITGTDARWAFGLRSDWFGF